MHCDDKIEIAVTSSRDLACEALDRGESKMDDRGITISRLALRRIVLGCVALGLLGVGYAFGHFTSKTELSSTQTHIEAKNTSVPITTSTTTVAVTTTQPIVTSSTLPTTTSVVPALVPALEICGTGNPVVKPVTLTLSCADGNSRAENLQWSIWNSSEATASGIETWNTCNPDCADSTTWDSTSATFTLTDPVSTSHGLLFEKLTVQDTGPTPLGMMRTITYNEAPSIP